MAREGTSSLDNPALMTTYIVGLYNSYTILWGKSMKSLQLVVSSGYGIYIYIYICILHPRVLEGFDQGSAEWPPVSNS